MRHGLSSGWAQLTVSLQRRCSAAVCFTDNNPWSARSNLTAAHRSWQSTTLPSAPSRAERNATGAVFDVVFVAPISDRLCRVRAQSIDPFRQCALAHCLLACRFGRRFCLRQRSPPETRALPQRALRALGTASLVAACGSI